MKSFTSPPKDNRPYEHLTFIQEDPTLPSQRKKPRTLTACDRCRARKVKCEQAVSAEKCDACLLARQECSFKARDQRFHHPGSAQVASTSPQSPVEDLQATAQLGSISSSTLRTKTPSPPIQKSGSRIGSMFPFKRSNSAVGRKVPSPAAPETMFSDVSAPARSLRPLSRAPVSPTLRQQHGPASPPTAFPSSPPLSPVTAQTSILFDYPSHPTFPRRDHMQSLITTFFEHFGPLFPFMRQDDIVQRGAAGRLWNIHALGIAALASRFSNLQEHSAEPKYQHSDAYLNVAKPLITQYKGAANLKGLQGLILLAWAECGNVLQQGQDNVAALLGQGSHTMTYIAETVRVARTLGVGFSANIDSFNVSREEVLATWWSVFLIDELTAWSNNQPAMLEDGDYDHELILLSNSHVLDAFQQLSVLSLHRRRVGNYLLAPTASSGDKILAIEGMRRVYLNICRTSQHLDLRSQNFQASLQTGTSSVYVAFHAIYFSAIIRSRLLGFSPAPRSPGSDRDPGVTSCQNMLELIRWCNGGHRTQAMANNLFLEAALYDGGSLLLSERRLVAHTALDSGRYLKEVNECLVALQDMGRVWVKASVRAASLSMSIEPSFNIMSTNMNAPFGMTAMGHISEYASHAIAPIAPSAVYAAAGWNHHPTGSSSYHDPHSLTGSSLSQTHHEHAYMIPSGSRASPSPPHTRQHHTPPNQMWGHPR